MTIDLSFIQTLEFKLEPNRNVGEHFPRFFHTEIWSRGPKSDNDHGSYYMHPLLLQGGQWREEKGATEMSERLADITRALPREYNYTFSIEDLKFALQKHRNKVVLYYRFLSYIPLTPQEVDKIIEALTIKEAEIAAREEQAREFREAGKRKAAEIQQQFNREMDAERAARTVAFAARGKQNV